jgi:(1->4)-alpha-D-glucan 1-alpha-D-glucosylmutase
MTGPVAAKGIEDTALYVYNRLLSLNEVGADPTRFGLLPGEVHAWMADRQRRWPLALSATSTHDTKRGEDVRARLNVISEIPGAWKAAVTRWRSVNRRHKPDVRGASAPDRNEEYLLYQTLLGAWPFDGDVVALRERLRAFMMKSLREAKVHTSWLSPDEEYEQAVFRFIDAILDRRQPNRFMQAFLPFQARIAELGIYNSLAQLLIKITAPGVPDFYQGTELWDLTLVDPDNRRPVDYETRRRMLADLTVCTQTEAATRLLEHRTDGRVKMFATARALGVRAAMRDVFEQGEYVPLQTSGVRRDCLFAFARRGAGATAITCVPRLIASLIPDGSGPPIGSAVWNETRIELPDANGTSVFTDVFTGATIDAQQVAGVTTLPAAAVFERFPIALLTDS